MTLPRGSWWVLFFLRPCHSSPIHTDTPPLEASVTSDQPGTPGEAQHTPVGSSSGKTEDIDQTSSWTSAECGVWLALSTLPGAGIGMFAGKGFRKGENLMEAGDHLIPVMDLDYHQGFDRHFLWDEYTWDGEQMRMPFLGLHEVNVASPGFGAAANSFMDFVNADEEYGTYGIPQELHRSKDPGAGAFTYFHSRHSIAEKDILPGQELFVSYGSDWFKTRDQLGPIPVKGDHRRAEMLYRSFVSKILRKRPVDKGRAAIAWDLWETFVIDSIWESRVMAALPDERKYPQMLQLGLVKTKELEMVRSQEWLQENGVCADNMYMNVSTIPQAGHGAFAARPLATGATILPVPLLHLPYRDIFEMYDLKKLTDPSEAKVVVGHQLMLNYCLGHAESTMLLSPYGPVFNLINHNQTLANVRLQWASPQRSQHNTTLLELSVYHLQHIETAQLAMELVALRDIQPDEEIFLDYGDAWEAAWQEHLRTWEPVKDADTYLSANEFNSRTRLLRTNEELEENPYPSNVKLRFYLSFEEPQYWKTAVKKGDDLEKFKDTHLSEGHVETQVIGLKQVNDTILYTALVPSPEKDNNGTVVVNEAPREAFFFEDIPGTTDDYLPNAFRHDIRIPDDLFPEAWKNLKNQDQSS